MSGTLTDAQFKELKENAIKIWESYDDEFGYATEKIARVNEITNMRDNWITIWGMFDSTNQQILISMISDETYDAIYKGYYL